MALHKSHLAEMDNNTNPFFRPAAEIRHTIYGMAQLTTSKNEDFVLSFGSGSGLFAPFSRQASLLHVCRCLRRELLPFIFKERNIYLLHDGYLSSFVPPSISTLSTDVLQMVSSVHLEFQLILPTHTRALGRRLKNNIQVMFQDDQYDVKIHLGTVWQKSDRQLLLTFLGETLDDINGNLQSALGGREIFERSVIMCLVSDGVPKTLLLQELSMEMQENSTQRDTETTDHDISTSPQTRSLRDHGVEISKCTFEPEVKTMIGQQWQPPSQPSSFGVEEDEVPFLQPPQARKSLPGYSRAQLQNGSPFRMALRELKHSIKGMHPVMMGYRKFK